MFTEPFHFQAREREGGGCGHKMSLLDREGGNMYWLFWVENMALGNQSSTFWGLWPKQTIDHSKWVEAIGLMSFISPNLPLLNSGKDQK